MMRVGENVYHRRADMFGRIESIEPERASARVKYEWPCDPKADAVLVPLDELAPEHEWR